MKTQTPFKLSSIQPYFWEWVTHEVKGDLGAKIEIKFKVKYRRPEQEEVEELIDRLMVNARAQITNSMRAGAGLGPAAADDTAETPKPLKPLTDAEVIKRFVLDWDLLVDDDNKPLAYNATNLKRFEKLLGGRAAIARTFYESFMKAPEKNSVPLLGTSTK